MSVETVRAAFGDRPDADVWAEAAGGGPRDRWLAAVVLGGQGHYAAAATLLRDLIGCPDPVLAALAGTTLASHRRQLGGHMAARSLDAAAVGRLLSAPPRADEAPDQNGVDRPGAWSDALLGLTADAVGLGLVAQARRLLERARPWSDTSWRARVRTGWVAAEVELAAGGADRAVPFAERAAAEAEAAGSIRHVAKSGLVLSAALTASGMSLGRRRAESLLDRTLDLSLMRGIFSLVWPSALLLAELTPDRRDTLIAIASDVLTSNFDHADGEMRQIAACSAWIPGALVQAK